MTVSGVGGARSPRWRFVLAAAVGGAVALAACRGADATGGSTLSVYAASSLTEVFRELEGTFERDHPGVDVALTFAGSQVLRIQIEQGAPADVYASADPEHVRPLVRSGRMRFGRAFAGNELVVIVPPDNPAGIETFADLVRAERLVLGTPSVPVGRYARRALARADSLVRPGFQAEVLDGLVSEEANVRLARSKVELGEADAAIVYRTDALASRTVRTVPLPEELEVHALYLIGPVEREGSPGLALEWVELVLSAEGRRVLERHGFGVSGLQAPAR